MMRRSAWVLAAAISSSVFAAPPDDRELIERAAARRDAGGGTAVSAQASAGAASSATAGAEDLRSAEKQAEAQAAISNARLLLIRARKALSESQPAAAARQARQALDLLAGLGGRGEAGELELQAEGVIARAARAGADVGAAPAAGDAGDASGDAALDRKVRAAGRIARHFEGSDTPDVDTRGDASALRDRTIETQGGDKYPYRPGRAIIDVDAVLERDRQRLAYEGALDTAYKADEARRLTAAHEARIAGDDVVQYPDNWPEIVKKREKWKDGAVAKSRSWTDKDGKEWYVAVYDIHDLIYVPPDFDGTSYIGGNSIAAADRAALRERSQIFGGYAEDLAAGIPLLRYFGGVDDFEYRGPKYSLERQDEIVRMIRAFTNRAEGATIETIAP